MNTIRKSRKHDKIPRSPARVKKFRRRKFAADRSNRWQSDNPGCAMKRDNQFYKFPADTFLRLLERKLFPIMQIAVATLMMER